MKMTYDLQSIYSVNKSLTFVILIDQKSQKLDHNICVPKITIKVELFHFYCDIIPLLL